MIRFRTNHAQMRPALERHVGSENSITLRGCWINSARIAGISDPIAVAIHLIGIGRSDAVVTRIANAVGVYVRLIWIGRIQAVVAGVWNAIIVCV